MKSIELGWLQRKDKWLPYPEVVFTELDEAYGRYHAPEVTEYYYDGMIIDGNRGVIEISIYFDDDSTSIESTIAHEWRHHWQYHKGIQFDHSPNFTGKEFFLNSKTEMDALLFEHKYARSNYSEQYLDSMNMYKPNTIYIIK